MTPRACAMPTPSSRTSGPASGPGQGRLFSHAARCPCGHRAAYHRLPRRAGCPHQMRASRHSSVPLPGLSFPGIALWYSWLSFSNATDVHRTIPYTRSSTQPGDITRWRTAASGARTVRNRKAASGRLSSLGNKKNSSAFFGFRLLTQSRRIRRTYQRSSSSDCSSEQEEEKNSSEFFDFRSAGGRLFRQKSTGASRDTGTCREHPTNAR